MKNGAKKKGRYQVKKDAGLVPHIYDRDSRRFSEGAWKNWPHRRDPVTRAIVWTLDDFERVVKVDAQMLFDRQTRFHQFVGV